jgi:hypothetical protein
MTALLARCCTGLSGFGSLSRAAAKAAGAKLRSMGLKPVARNWQARAEICATCPMRSVHKGVSYCGRPFLSLPVRDEVLDGCGCPTLAKAKHPDEHCPIDRRHQRAEQHAGGCTCKWCTAPR